MHGPLIRGQSPASVQQRNKGLSSPNFKFPLSVSHFCYHFHMRRLQNQDNACSPNPCKNGGKCSVGDSGRAECDCRDPFTGNRCQVGSGALTAGQPRFLINHSASIYMSMH